MGLFDSIRKKEQMAQAVEEYFKCINAYTPSFTSFEGSLYEMETTRAAIHSFANLACKLTPHVLGAEKKQLERTLQFKPNQLMDTKKYLYRLATEVMCDNTAIIAPLYDERGVLIGYYPLHTKKCQLVNAGNKQYIRYEFQTGQYGAVELNRAGRMTRMQYEDELFGSSNRCFFPTIDLMTATDKGIQEGIKQGASIRFMAKLAQTLKPKDLEEERKNFTMTNLRSDNNGGVLLFDQKYQEVKQINSTPYIVSAEQMRVIKDNVYDYFGTNDKIMHSEFNSDEFNAYYEAQIEPFAIEASLVHTNMTFTDRERALGSSIEFTSNRLQYMSNSEKLETVVQLFDRGFITHNEGRAIMQLEPVEDGDKFYIRKEYAEKDNLDLELKIEAEATGEGSENNAADGE